MLAHAEMPLNFKASMRGVTVSWLIIEYNLTSKTPKLPQLEVGNLDGDDRFLVNFIGCIPIVTMPKSMYAGHEQELKYSHSNMLVKDTS